MKSLFGRSGGRKGNQSAAINFSCKLLSDPRVNRFFEDVGIEKLFGVPSAPFQMAFGGPRSDVDQDSREGDQTPLEKGLTDIEVDAVIDILGESLTDESAQKGSS